MKDQGMQPNISDETLMAFADGALDEAEFQRVAEAVEQDEALAARLEALAAGSSLAREGFGALLQPVPRSLETAVRDQIAQSQRAPFWQRNWVNWLLPITSAAVAAMAVIVFAPALQTSTTPQSSTLAALSSVEVAEALDTLASGESTTLAGGTVVNAIATFTDADGTLCREFETEGSADYIVVSCRDGADWRVQLALGSPTDDDSYRPASGLELLDAYLSTIGAGAPLSLEDEQAALAR
jgi:hypothetical protein